MTTLCHKILLNSTAIDGFRPKYVRRLKYSVTLSSQKRIGDSIANEILMFFRNKKKSAQDVYISEPIDTDKDGNTLTLQDIMADQSNIFDDIEVKLRVEQLGECMDRELEPREKEIISNRYGLWGRQALTQREVATKLGISRSYVSRIEKRALEKLKKGLEDKTER